MHYVQAFLDKYKYDGVSLLWYVKYTSIIGHYDMEKI